MSISFACPSCGAQYSVGDNLAGKKAKCRDCGTSITVPQPSFALDEDEVSLDAMESISSGTVISGKTASHKMFVPRQAEPEAFAVRDEPKFTEKKAPPSPDRSGPDNFSWAAVLLCILALGFNGYLTFSSLSAKADATVGGPAPRPYLVVAVTVFALALCWLVVMAPAAVGAWKVACQIINARPPKSIYFRALGLAAVAMLPILLASLIDRADNPAMVMALATLSAVPIAFGILKYAHHQLTMVAAVAAGAGLVFVGIAAFVTTFVVGTARDFTIPAYDRQVATAKENLQTADKGTSAVASKNGQPTSPDVAQAETAAADKLGTAFLQIDTAIKRDDATRQLAAPLFDQVQARVADVKAIAPSNPVLNGVDDKIAAYQKAIAALPSETPPDDLKLPAQPAGDWSAPVLASTVTVYGLDLVPPTGAKIDLSSSDAAGYKWDLPNIGLLLIRRSAAPVADQQRPWLINRNVAASTTQPFRIDASNTTPVSVGTIGGLTFTRVAPPAGSSDEVIDYCARIGDAWLMCVASSHPGADQAKLLEYSIKTLHPHPATTPPTDPFDLTDLQQRWTMATPQDQALIIKHIAARPDAEDAMLLAAGGIAPGPQFAQILPLLSQIATEKSLPLLWKAYETNVQPELVRPLLAKLDPTRADAVAMAERDLKSRPPKDVVPAMAALAAAPADPSRAREIGMTLSDAMDEPGVMMQATRDDSFQAALMKWGSPETNHKLAKVLDDQNSQPLMRHVAMNVLAQTHDKRYAFPLCRWLVKDSRSAREALITLGPGAEQDVMKVLTMSSTEARMAAAQVLADIGGRRSISALEASIQVDRDPDYQDQAKASIEQIKDHLKTPPAPIPSPIPAPTQPVAPPAMTPHN